MSSPAPEVFAHAKPSPTTRSPVAPGAAERRRARRRGVGKAVLLISAAWLVHAFVACQSGVPVDAAPAPTSNPVRGEPGDFECSSVPDDAMGDAGVDAGAVSSEPAPDPYGSIESAVANFSGVCRRACECGLEQEQDCLMRALSEDLVADARELAGLTAAEAERCRAAVEAVDRCSLVLDCDDYEFFLSNLAASFAQGVCFTFEGRAVTCPVEFPCLVEELEFEAGCVDLWEAIDQVLQNAN